MKTKLFFLFLIFNLSLSIFNCFSQAGQWTWMSGDSTSEHVSVYGTPLISGPDNRPGARYEAGTFTDSQNNFWLYGGSGFGYINTISGPLSDLWKYNPVTNEWTFIKGDTVVGAAGVYGTQGVPSILNRPGQRSVYNSWNETAGYLWLFGGFTLTPGIKNDLWRYNISTNEWTWMKGSQGIGYARYGTKGVASPANNPGGRYEATCSWSGSDSTLWLFGGQGYDADSNQYLLNDLWKYDILTNQWTWMSGDSIGPVQSFYGIKGVASPNNKPAGRMPYCSWTDHNGNFWFFGGGAAQYFNDLWKYSVSTNQWTWMNGDSTVANYGGSFGVKCLSVPQNSPPHRMENKARWVDGCGNFWMYGGHQGNHCDLWKYDVASNEWMWITGDSLNCQKINGIKGVASPFNNPGTLLGAPSWTSSDGSFWMFGGSVPATGGNTNDLWKYSSDSMCGGCPTTTSIQETNNQTHDIEIFPNPAGEEFTVSGLQFPAELMIYDVLGKLILSKHLTTVNNGVKTVNLSNGVYIIKLYTHEGVFQKKLIVNH